MADQTCSNCGVRPAQPGQRYCKECHAEYMREWRSKAVSVRLPDEDYEWVRVRSGKRGESLSAIIGEAVRRMRQAEEQAIARGVARMVQQARQPDDGDEDDGNGNVSRETKPA